MPATIRDSVGAGFLPSWPFLLCGIGNSCMGFLGTSGSGVVPSVISMLRNSLGNLSFFAEPFPVKLLKLTPFFDEHFSKTKTLWRTSLPLYVSERKDLKR